MAEDAQSFPSWPAFGGEMGARIRAFDWASTPLGPIRTWPHELRTIVDLALGSSAAMSIKWGPENTHLYNDAYAALIGSRHPDALGRGALETFAETRDEIGDALAGALAGQSVLIADHLHPADRWGRDRDRWFDLSYHPVRNDHGDVLGVFTLAVETTERVLADRACREAEAELRRSEARQAFSLRLSDALRELADPVDIQVAASRLLGEEIGANRVLYVDIVDETEAVISHDYVDGVPSVAGRYPASNFGEGPTAALRRGEIVAIGDVPNDPNLSQATKAEARRVDVAAVMGVGLVKEGRWVAALSAHSRAPRYWTPAEIGLLEETAERTWAAVERAEAEAAARDTERRFRQFGSASSDVLWMSNVHSLRFEYVSPAFRTVYGQLRRQLMAGDGLRRWAHMILPEDRHKAFDAFRRVRKGEAVTHEFRIRRASDGQVRWILNTDFPLRDPDGSIVCIGGIGRDVTEQKETSAHMTVLVSELQHRTRNLMAVVRATADATLRSSASLAEFKSRFRDRLAALSRAQSLLSRLEEGTRVTFDQLLRAELSAVGGVDLERVTLDGPKGVPLRSSTVQTFAMALHELATNALKYGALKQANGRLQVRWRSLPAGEDGRPWLSVDWRESGVTMPVNGAGKHGGQGRELIEQALPYQLGAKTSFVMAPDGVHCTIALPVSRRTGAKDRRNGEQPPS